MGSIEVVSKIPFRLAPHLKSTDFHIYWTPENQEAGTIERMVIFKPTSRAILILRPTLRTRKPKTCGAGHWLSWLKEISELIFQKHGYDFRNYAMSSFKRRIPHSGTSNLNVDGLMKNWPTSPVTLTIFWTNSRWTLPKCSRSIVLACDARRDYSGILLNHKQFKIWHAGCSSGEEVLSMAIMLERNGHSARCNAHCYRFDSTILEKAKAATHPIKTWSWTRRTIRFQGTSTLKIITPEKRQGGVP